MAGNLIVLGDKSSHGGVVVSASGESFINGIGIARLGDSVACPIPRHGTNPIVTGDSTALVDGRPVARNGDSTACGATMISSQSITTDLI